MVEEFDYEEFENTEDLTNLEPWKIDSMIEQVKKNNKEIEKFKDIRDKRKSQLDLDFEKKKEQLLNRNHFLLTTLNTYAKTQELESTSTQYKYTSLSGNIVIKKPTKKINKPAAKYEEQIQKVYPEFVEVKEEKKLKWTDLKKRFTIQGDSVYDKETGEDVSDIIKYKETQEETIIK